MASLGIGNECHNGIGANPYEWSHDQFDPSSLILRAIGPMCATGLSQDQVSYFDGKLHSFIVDMVQFLMTSMPAEPEEAVFAWLTDRMCDQGGTPTCSLTRLLSKIQSDTNLAPPDTPRTRRKHQTFATDGDKSAQVNTEGQLTRSFSMAGFARQALLDREHLFRRAPPMADDDKYAIISRVPEFQHLDVATLKRMSQLSDVAKILDGEEALTVGAECNGVYLVVSGRGKISVLKDGGSIGQGDVFGLKEMIADGVSNCTVEAYGGPMIALHIPAHSFHSLGLGPQVGASLQKSKKAARAGEEVLRVEPPPAYSEEQRALHEADRALIINAIRNNQNLAELLVMDDEQAQQVCKGAHRLWYTEGQVVFERGSNGKEFYIVHDGAFEVSSIEGDIQRRPLRAGDTFGELALLYSCERSANVTCIRDGSVWVITRPVLRSVLSATAECRARMYADLIRHISYFDFMNSEDRLNMCQAFEEMCFVHDEVIVREGDPAHAFYVIFEGECSILQGGQKIGVLTRGDYFGEKALVENDVRDATIQVESISCTVLLLDRTAFGLLNQQDVPEAVYVSQGASKSKLATKMMQLVHSHTAVHENLGSLSFRSGRPAESWSRQTSANEGVPRHRLDRIGLLGRGGFGFVSLERDRETGLFYALKAMSKAHIMKERLQDAVVNEKTCMELLASPFIVKLICTFRDEQHIFLLMEACFGGELFETYSTNKGFFGSEPHTLFYAACASMALEHMHSRKVIYRDLKLENSLLTTSGYLKLTDMGIAKVVLGKTYTVCGSVDYFAPETLRQEGHNRAVDWWALGVMIYIMMTGRCPFEAEEAMGTYKKIIKGFARVAFPESMPASCVALVRSLCQKKPEERLTMGQTGVQALMKHAWFESFNWDALMELDMVPPYVPDVDEAQVVAKAQRTVLQPLPTLPYVDDGSGWDNVFQE